VVLADARTLRTVAVLKTIGQIYGLAFSPDGRMVAASGANGTVTLWDTRTHRTRLISAGSSQARDVAFSPNGRTLAVGSADLVRIFDVRTRVLTAVLNEHTDVVNGVAFSPGGQTLASASGDGTALLWNVDPRAAVRRLYRRSKVRPWRRSGRACTPALVLAPRPAPAEAQAGRPAIQQPAA
jgi:WD40 repeat protein